MAVDTVKHTPNKKNSPDAIDVVKLVNDCINQINEGEKLLGHVNIIIAGKTGVGKSTLINAAFRENLAETGMGMPVTQSSKIIEQEGMPIRIYDTVGLELTEKTKNDTIKDIHDLIQEKLDDNDPDKFIHCMWYCVQSNSDRLEKPEQDLIADISKQIPVVLIITKSYLKKHSKEFAEVIRDFNLPVKDICIVLAQTYDDEEITVEAYGIENLLEVTLNLLPDSAQDAWINAQSSIELKKQKAMQVVKETVAMSFGAGFIPVPVADIIMLIPTEIAMMTRITNIYGLKITRDKMRRILFIIFGAAGAASAGIFFAKGLLKFVPGLNVTLGGAINGAAAASMTLAFGRTYIFIMEKLLTGEMSEDDLETADGRKKIQKVMRDEMDDEKVDDNFKSMAKDFIKSSTPTEGGIFNRIKNIFSFGKTN